MSEESNNCLLVFEVVEIQGSCLVHQVSDRIYIKEDRSKKSTHGGIQPGSALK